MLCYVMVHYVSMYVCMYVYMYILNHNKVVVHCTVFNSVVLLFEHYILFEKETPGRRGILHVVVIMIIIITRKVIMRIAAAGVAAAADVAVHRTHTTAASMETKQP